MDAVWVALIVAVIGPGIMQVLTARQRHRERTEDYLRQDAVAAKAEEAAALLVEFNESVVADARLTNDKLDVIHTLVNSTMTAMLQTAVDATTRELALMKEVVALHRAAGQGPSEETLTAIDTTRLRLDEMVASLTARHQAEEQAKEQGTSQS